ncbi:MAG: hypothetical protein IPO08_05220 [Xanthomonadales bacterium]|nr:hypothetical protein [Xanthomonadales bacterium]
MDDDMAGALVKIECANLIEQRAGARFLRAVRSLRGFRSGVLFPSEMMGAIEQAIADSAAELAKN